MRLELDHGIVIILSRRNLHALLIKLDSPGSTCTLVGTDARIDGKPTAVIFGARAEPDHIHYRDRPAGAMHPDTEARLARDDHQPERPR